MLPLLTAHPDPHQLESGVKHRFVCAHEKFALGSSSLAFPKPGLLSPTLHEAHTHCWHAFVLTLQKLNQLSYKQYYRPMTASVLCVPLAFRKAVSLGATSLSHIHICHLSSPGLASVSKSSHPGSNLFTKVAQLISKDNTQRS